MKMKKLYKLRCPTDLHLSTERWRSSVDRRKMLLLVSGGFPLAIPNLAGYWVSAGAGKLMEGILLWIAVAAGSLGLIHAGRIHL
jgi:hypothetical protein